MVVAVLRPPDSALLRIKVVCVATSPGSEPQRLQMRWCHIQRRIVGLAHFLNPRLGDWFGHPWMPGSLRAVRRALGLMLAGCVPDLAMFVGVRGAAFR